MKRNQSNSHRPLLQVLGTAVLAAALVAGPGLAGVAFAVEPTPTPPPSTSAPTPTSSAVSTQVPESATTPTPAPAAPVPSVAPAPTTPPSPDPASGSINESMAAAVGVGGAEMGQRSARVAATSSSTSFKRLSTEALGTEGTWMPTFGIQGLDVSGHQPSVDWQHQWNMGARFAYVKASEGNYYTNPSYSSQYQGSRNVGMVRGAYHFAIPNWSSGADQARYFVQNGGGWTADGYTMPPVLDFEFNPYEGRTINGFYFGNTCYGMSPAQLGSWVRDFGNTMQSLTGRVPVIYTNTSWWNQCLGNPSGFGDYPLWVAAYPSSPTNNAGPVPSASWSTYSIWQYSSTGPLAGDSNVWNGDYSGLKAFASSGIPPAATQQIGAYRSSYPALGNTTTSIVCGLANGGCYQGFQGGTVMWSGSSGAFAVIAGPVAAAWRATGAEGGPAGYPTSDIVCGLKDNGCFQNFQGGSILSSSTSGAALIQPGAIRDYWAKNGYENGPLGYPTSNTTCGLRLSGCFQLFQAGSVLSSSSTGAQLVKSGPILDAWSRAGFENGLLGYPSADATCDATSCTQSFVGGVVAWTGASGAWPIFMGMADSWKSARSQSVPIGFPIGTEVCGIRGGGCFQLFQGGTLLFSPATGAFPVTGRTLDYWQKTGFENGSLGYPTSFAVCNLPDSGCLQSFEHGTVTYSAATSIQTVTAGAMRDGWNAYDSVTGSLGYPTSPKYCGLANDGCFQMFAKGALMYSPSTGAHPSLNGPIRDLWQREGFENGRLGYPASTVLCGLRNSGCFQNYLGGSVMWSQATDAHALHFGPIRDAWVKSGFENGSLGYPASAQICGLRDGGCFQNFEKGTVMWSPQTGAQPVTSAAIQTRWAQAGFESGSLGYPTSGSVCGLRNGGCFQNFEKGTIMWSAASGAHPMVPGPIQQAWAGQGFENGTLGYPTAPQTCTTDGQSCAQTFQSGRIEWTALGGAKIRP
ncbi:lysozyme M1 [Pseudarthrobacter sp. MDT3-26]|nr:GH25 family lysozyme [Pseudarthrobacter sp. MDT3-26]MCO4263776.1 lysozyme M1 [Pseudarthrobacter sp. MDT3-26]